MSAAGLRALAVRLRAAPPTSPEPDPDSGIPLDTDAEEIIAGYASELSPLERAAKVRQWTGNDARAPHKACPVHRAAALAARWANTASRRLPSLSKPGTTA